VPSWERYAPTGEEIAIQIDPGQAFGTGAHATTRLILREIEGLCDARAPVARFLDVGCGSGILAIATALLWPASTGVAVDVDPPAVDAASENCEKNGVSARVAVSATPLADIPGTFDLILANIQADVLRALAEDLAARMNPGGHLVLSGLLAHQAGDVARYIADVSGLTVMGTRREDDEPDWSSVLLHRPA